MFQSSPALELRLTGAEGEDVDARWWGEASMVSRRRWCCAYISWYICTLRSKLTRSAVYLKQKFKPRVGQQAVGGKRGGEVGGGGGCTAP